VILFIYIVYLGFNVAKAANIDSKDLPILRDPKLRTELVFEQNFEREPNQLSSVTKMDFLGEDIILLNKNDGTVNRITDGKLQDVPLLDVSVANKRERGLLGITSSKGNDGNIQDIFLYFTESAKSDGSDICETTRSCKPGTEPLGNRLYRYEFDGDKITNPKLLLNLPATPASGHNGGALALGPDNNLYLTIGDVVGWVNKSSSTKAQNFNNGTDPDARAGILRVSQDGKPVSEGILGKKFPLNLYYAYGIRNSFGIDFDPVTGNLWDTENGPDYGDEINLVEPGFNSGWMKVQGIWKPAQSSSPKAVDLVAGNKSLHPEDLVNFDGNGKYSPPEFIWKKVAGPTALKFFDSEKLGKKYENDLFVGCVNLGQIFHFDLNNGRTEISLRGPLEDKIADSHEELDEVIFGEGFGAITDIKVGPDGYLYTLTFKGEKVKIYRILPNV
jgi:glucose/arabinose dehydrogenase